MRRFVAITAVFGLAFLAACGSREAAPISAYEGRLTDWASEILADDPELADQAGLPAEAVDGGYANRLTDRSALAVETRRAASLRRLAELRGLDTAELTIEQGLTYAVLTAQFETAAAAADFDYGDFSQLGGLSPYVLNQLDSAFSSLPEFLDRRHDIASIADAEAYLARLDRVARALDQETERAQADAAIGVRPPVFIIDAAVAQLEAIIATPLVRQSYATSLRAKLEALIAAEADLTARDALRTRALSLEAQAEVTIRDRIIPAHQRAVTALRAIRINATDEAGVWRLPGGPAYYRASLALATTTALGPDEIHRIGLDRVTALNRELDIALRRIGLTEGPVGARLAQLTADPRHRYENSDAGRAQLLADIEARIATAQTRTPQWFGRQPQAPLEVARVPTFQEAGQPGAYYSPPSLDGATPGVYYVNLRDLSEMTRIDLPTQDFHEAVPGHHIQSALAQEQTALPLLRRLLTFNAYGEGWGLYAEQLADESGFYDSDPIGRIGYLRWQLWRAARLVADTGLHAQRWTRQQTIDYLIGVTGDAPGVVATEVDRYIVWPGQACGYEIGRRELVRLREHARTELGPDFDLRAFHDAVLRNGEVPLPVLEQLIEDWIPEQRRAVERERRRR